MATDADKARLQETISEVLSEGGYASEIEAMRDLSITIAMSKLNGYERECERFRQKYGCSFEQMQRQLQDQTGQEDFQVEDDLLDWEYAWRALQHWQQRLDVLQNA